MHKKIHTEKIKLILDAFLQKSFNINTDILIESYENEKFTCICCGTSYFKDDIGFFNLELEKSFLNHELCCNCSDNFKNNEMILYLKHILRCNKLAILNDMKLRLKYLSRIIMLKDINMKIQIYVFDKKIKAYYTLSYIKDLRHNLFSDIFYFINIKSFLGFSKFKINPENQIFKTCNYNINNHYCQLWLMEHPNKAFCKACLKDGNIITLKLNK